MKSDLVVGDTHKTGLDELILIYRRTVGHVIRRTRSHYSVYLRGKGPCQCRAEWKSTKAHHSWESDVGEIKEWWWSLQMKWMLVLVFATIAIGTFMGTSLPVQLWWSDCRNLNASNSHLHCKNFRAASLDATNDILIPPAILQLQQLIDQLRDWKSTPHIFE